MCCSLATVYAQSIPEMVFIKGGQLNRTSSYNGDFREITLSDFYISPTEVTVKQYRNYCNATGTAMPEAPEWGWQDNAPIINLHWQDAINYCKWLSKKTNQKFTLPSIAQWEYVASEQGTLTLNKPLSTETLEKQAWYNANSNNKTHKIALKEPNKLGVYDLFGNASEWVLDECLVDDVLIIDFTYNPEGAEKWMNTQDEGRLFSVEHYLFGTSYWEESESSFPAKKQTDYIRGTIRGGFRLASTNTVSYKFNENRSHGSLKINSNPPNAKIKLNKAPVGRTPFKSDSILEGTYNVELKLNNYFTINKTITVTKGKPVILDIALESKDILPKMAYVNTIASPSFPSNGYSISNTEITVKQYLAFCNATQHPKPEIPKWGWQDHHPVVNVSWNDAVAYCKWLQNKTKLPYSLPTIKQWEYAAKATDTIVNLKYSGANDPQQVAWYKRNSGNSVHNVATKKPNDRYIYDMSGNVTEWCLNPNNKSNTTKNTSKPIKGGSWKSIKKEELEINKVTSVKPENKTTDLGFRVVLNQEKTSFNSSVLHDAVDYWYTNKKEALIKYGHISNWDVSQCNYMDTVFYNKTFFNADISQWEMYNVESAMHMFEGAYLFQQHLPVKALELVPYFIEHPEGLDIDSSVIILERKIN